MAATTPVLLTKRAEEGLVELYKQCQTAFQSNWDFRGRMITIDKEYARESDESSENARAKLANSRGDKSKFQNVIIPVVMPQVEAAVTYQASVFLTGVPLFGVAASPEYEEQAIAMETLIDNQAIRGGWDREFKLMFRDGFKYNLAAVEVAWDREITAAIDTDLNFSAKMGKPKNVIWEGNKVKRMDMYNTFFDTRVAPSDVHKFGEYAVYTEIMSRVRLKQLINTLPNVRLANIRAAFESGSATVTNDIESYNYFVPEINNRVLLDPSNNSSPNWLAWAELARAEKKFQYSNIYEVSTIYVRIIPEELSLRVPEDGTPQVWKLIVVNHSVIIYAERQTNAHGWLPILFSQPNDDGLSYQTKSLADNVLPIQDIASALSNADIAARRRAISDRVLYDPSRITEAQINNPNPSAKIPVRPSAYGKNIAESVYAFPFRDDQSQITQQKLMFYKGLANEISGSNPVRQGQFVKGNKTQSEFETVMGNANGRDQLTAMGYEAQVFMPLKHIVCINNLQYQGGTSLYSRDKQREVNVDPVELRKAVMQFKVSDGLTPTDKLMDTDTMIVAMQQIGSSPQIAAGYNIAPLFSYLMKLKGAARISEFEKSKEQVAYEQAMAQWQQLCMQLAKQNPELKQYPPQPMPQQFGYNPGGNMQMQGQEGTDQQMMEQQNGNS